MQVNAGLIVPVQDLHSLFCAIEGCSVNGDESNQFLPSSFRHIAACLLT